MKIAFVGIRRPYKLMHPDYIRMFNKYHLEIAFYYAEYGGNDVTVTTVDYTSAHEEFPSGGRFRNITEPEFRSQLDGTYDVVIHWRDFFADLYQERSVNVVHTCDWNYPKEWVERIYSVFNSKMLYGLDCYPTWHKENLFTELGGRVPMNRLLAGHTFGVDTSIYAPSVNKDPYALLWSSDPGRGLNGAVQLAIQLFQKDRRFRLHVCHPDYTKMQKIQHPAIVWHGFVPNGPNLWSIFNSTGVLPYTSTFKEPSSRAFRQAQSAGSLVLYPPDMGSPSRFIQDGKDAFVRPLGEWEKLILDTVDSTDYVRMGKEARLTALSESWQIQAQRFNETFTRILEEQK